MACSNCFNGCADTISDQCVKYTGVDIPGLGIASGDPLLVIENQIINKILELMTGEGVIPVIAPADLCPLVSSFLPGSGPITLNDVISALFRSICALDARLVLAEGKLVTLNADYVIGCLTGVVPASGTHAILQATITKLCSVSSDLTTLTAELFANYVLISDINSYIAAYISGIPTSTLYNTRMIPYTAVPYFGVTVGFFDITGAGIGQWEKIYLCNGQNLTPDLRGRVLVGNTTMGNTAFNPAVDPAISGNPSYAQNDTIGANLAVLTNAGQLPLHSHSTIVTITDPGHFHPNSKINPVNGSGSELNYDSVGDKEHYGIMNTLPATTGLKGNGNGPSPNVTVQVEPTGGSPVQGHNNIQPVHATNYIIYIP
jgi:microcystin-dependent protein